MARYGKRWMALAGGLLSVMSWLSQASAQGPGYTPLAPPSGYPAPMSMSPDGSAPPGVPQGGPSNPNTIDYHGTPNGFSDDEYYSQPQPYIFKLRGEYLLWHVTNPRIATVVATTSSNPNLVNGVGAIADPGTSSLLGPGTYNYHTIDGGKFTAGFAPGCFLPFEISGFWLSTPTTSLLNVSSDGSANSPVLARPFRAPNLASLNGLGQQVVLAAGFPGTLAGNINVSAEMNLYGIETNFLFNLGTSDNASLDVIVGYRYTNLQESLTLSNSVQSVNSNVNIAFNPVNPAGLPQGFTSIAADSFMTQNQFNGGTIGIRPVLNVGQFSVLSDLKLSIGATHQTLKVNGVSTLLSPDGSVQTASGGLLAVASNSGTFSQDSFSVIPEININVGFNLTRNVRLFAAYNIFYWSSVVRPGDQLNNRVDSRQVPTDPTFNGLPVGLPGPSFVTTGFLGQGVSLGVEIGF